MCGTGFFFWREVVGTGLAAKEELDVGIGCRRWGTMINNLGEGEKGCWQMGLDFVRRVLKKGCWVPLIRNY